MALFNNFPYSNTEEINLDYTLNKLNELYSRGENLYDELQSWKTATDEANEAWKSDLLSDINEWQNSVTHSLEEWKTSVDSEVSNALTALSNQITAELAQAKTDLRNEVADLASAAAASKADAAASEADAAASQSAAAQSAQSAINSAAAAAQSEQNINESAEQIETNKNDITDLKSAIFGDKLTLTGWEKGGFNTTNGTNYASDTYIRNQTMLGAADGVTKISCTNDYAFLMYAWNLSGTYIGAYKTDETWSKTASGWKSVTQFDLTTIPNYRIKVSMRRADSSSDIAESEGDQFEYYRYTDKTLSVPNKAADSKAVGDILQITTTETDEIFDNSSWAAGYVGATRISTTTSNGDKYNPTPVRVYKGETINIKLVSTLQYLYFYWAWCDENEHYSSRNGDSTKVPSSSGGYYYYETTLTAPRDGYFVMSFRPGSAVYEAVGSSVTGKYSRSVIDTLVDSVSNLDSSVTSINNKLNEEYYYHFPDDDTLPINVCHRGLCKGNLPENTLVAFAECKNMEWTWVESDIRRTSDGVWVMLHDATINRTARNADGSTISSTINIADITYEQALTYDFGIYAGVEYAGTKIPTLDEFLNLCNKLHLYAQIEIKNSTWTTEESASVWAIVEKYRMQKKCAWLCSSVGGVDNITNIDPYAPVVATNSVGYSYIDPEDFDTTTSYWTNYKTGKNKVYVETLASTLSTKALMDNYIDFCHSKGLYAGVYGVDSVDQINSLSDRFDIVSGQYYRYNKYKAQGLYS